MHDRQREHPGQGGQGSPEEARPRLVLSCLLSCSPGGGVPPPYP